MKQLLTFQAFFFFSGNWNILAPFGLDSGKW
jgi:hypothetical protein